MFQGQDWVQLTKTKQPPFEGITVPELRQWLEGCLQKNRIQRLTAPQVLAQPWFKGVQTYMGPPISGVTSTTTVVQTPRYSAAATYTGQVSMAPVATAPVMSYAAPMATSPVVSY